MRSCGDDIRDVVTCNNAERSFLHIYKLIGITEIAIGGRI